MTLKHINRVKSMKVFCLITATLFISSCQSTPIRAVKQINCSDPRPEMCTMEYQPVCGFYLDNSSKTYPNACTACSDKNVVRYIKDECSK